MASTPFNSRLLWNGKSVPILGLGTWRAKGTEVYEAVKHALNVGYRHFDTAFAYQNEKFVGDAIRDGIAELGLSREDIFIVTKLMNTCHRSNLVMPCLKESLKNLGLTYVDLFLIHTPIARTPLLPSEVSIEAKKASNGENLYDEAMSIPELWKEMEKCVDMGLAVSIGVSNFNSQQVQAILDSCTIKPVINQVECHPFLQQNKLREFCEKHDIVLTSFRGLGGQVKKPGHPHLLDQPEIKKLATKYKKSPAQILLRWQLDKGNIVLVKSSNKSRIEENTEIFDFKLCEADKSELSKLDYGHRYCPFLPAKGSKQYPFHIEF